MADRSSGFRTDVSGWVPAALMSSSTAMSHEKVRRAEGTCSRVRGTELQLHIQISLLEPRPHSPRVAPHWGQHGCAIKGSSDDIPWPG